MARAILFVILLVVVLIGGMYFLAKRPHQQPTHTIEVAVPQGGNAH